MKLNTSSFPRLIRIYQPSINKNHPERDTKVYFYFWGVNEFWGKILRNLSKNRKKLKGVYIYLEIRISFFIIFFISFLINLVLNLWILFLFSFFYKSNVKLCLALVERYLLCTLEILAEQYMSNSTTQYQTYWSLKLCLLATVHEVFKWRHCLPILPSTLP